MTQREKRQGAAPLTRRWSAEDRLAAWQREDRLRWQADRLQAYARLISALDDWRAELRRARTRRKSGEPFDAAAWERHFLVVSELVVLVALTAPERVSDLAQRCTEVFMRTGSMLMDKEAHSDAILVEFATAARDTGRFMDALRADLSLGSDGQAANGAAPRPVG
jgi:hypothetical protein